MYRIWLAYIRRFRQGYGLLARHTLAVSARAGIIESTFKTETETDLFASRPSSAAAFASR